MEVFPPKENALEQIFRADQKIIIGVVQSKHQTRLPNNTGSIRAPSWSPDGTKISFYPGSQDVNSPENYSSDIYVMDVKPIVSNLTDAESNQYSATLGRSAWLAPLLNFSVRWTR